MMNDFVLIGFAGETLRLALFQMQKDHLIDLAAGVAIKSQNGKVLHTSQTRRQAQNPKPAVDASKEG